MKDTATEQEKFFKIWELVTDENLAEQARDAIFNKQSDGETYEEDDLYSFPLEKVIEYMLEQNRLMMPGTMELEAEDNLRNSLRDALIPQITEAPIDTSKCPDITCLSELFVSACDENGTEVLITNGRILEAAGYEFEGNKATSPPMKMVA